MKLRKHSALAERLEDKPPSAIWEIDAGYDLYTYILYPRDGWTVSSGAAESNDDILISGLLRGTSFPTRRAALEATQAAITFLNSKGQLDGVRQPAEV